MWQPTNWKKQLENIREMRSTKTAPVDTMGASKCADPDADPKIFRFQILLSLLLSSQTKDEITSAAMTRLREQGCSVLQICAISAEDIRNIIHPVGFAPKKSNYMKQVAEICRDKYECDIPNSLQGLCALPGIGPKMGNLIMELAWGEITGIAVDTHVHRIANRLGWVRKTTKTPEQTQKELESWMPRDLWSDANLLLVGFGQEICAAIQPKCYECLNQKVCPFGEKTKVPPSTNALAKSPTKTKRSPKKRIKVEIATEKTS